MRGKKAAAPCWLYFRFLNFGVTINFRVAEYSAQFLGRTAMTSMDMGNWLKSEMEYGRDLAGSGWQGARTAWDSVIQTKPVGELLSRWSRPPGRQPPWGSAWNPLRAAGAAPQNQPCGRRSPGHRRRRRWLHRLCRLGDTPDLLRGRPRRHARDQHHPRTPIGSTDTPSISVDPCASSATETVPQLKPESRRSPVFLLSLVPSTAAIPAAVVVVVAFG